MKRTGKLLRPAVNQDWDRVKREVFPDIINSGLSTLADVCNHLSTILDIDLCFDFKDIYDWEPYIDITTNIMINGKAYTVYLSYWENPYDQDDYYDSEDWEEDMWNNFREDIAYVYNKAYDLQSYIDDRYRSEKEFYFVKKK